MLLVLVPTIATFAATSYFKPAKVYISAPNNTGTTAIAVADLNRDGKPDLVVGDVVGTESNNSGYVGVLLGNGNGTFRPIHTFPSGGHAVTSVAVGDLNGDGKIDVAVSQLEGVAVLLGKGNGTFQPAQTYAINSLAGNTGIAIADVNGDGHPDLLVAVECDPTYPDCNHQGDAGVMLGNGDGTFGPVQLYGSGGSFATSIAVADVNLDGKLDLILDNAFDTAGDGHGSVAVLLGNGDGTFQATQNYDIGGYDGGSVTVADLNGDGKPDLVAANDCASNNCALSTLGVLLGNGDGTFQKVKIITGTGGWTTLQVAVTDVNGDSIPDLLVDNFCDNNTVCDHGTVGLLLGHGDGTFGQAQRYNSGGLYANSFAIADVNGDGFADVFVAHGSAICCGSEGVVGVLLSSH
jgi:hypothetical protein